VGPGYGKPVAPNRCHYEGRFYVPPARNVRERFQQNVAALDVRDIGLLALAKSGQHAALFVHELDAEARAPPIAPLRAAQRRQNTLRLNLADALQVFEQLALLGGQLRFARQIAIDKRTVCRVDFTAPGTISVTQAFADGTPVQSETITLPPDVQYVVVAGMPSPPTPTPDNIGNGKIAIDFDRAGGGSGTTIYFQPDGSALDAAGRSNDGVIYVARPNELSGARAITLLGTTGRIRGWRLGPRPGGGVVWQ